MANGPSLILEVIMDHRLRQLTPICRAASCHHRQLRLGTIAVGSERPRPADFCRCDVESQIECNLSELLESLVIEPVARPSCSEVLEDIPNVLIHLYCGVSRPLPSPSSCRTF